MLSCKDVWRLDGDSQAPGMGVNASLKMEYLGSAVRKWSQLDNQISLFSGTLPIQGSWLAQRNHLFFVQGMKFKINHLDCLLFVC